MPRPRPVRGEGRRGFANAADGADSRRPRGEECGQSVASAYLPDLYFTVQPHDFVSATGTGLPARTASSVSAM